MKKAVVVLGLLLIIISLFCLNKAGEREAILHIVDNPDYQSKLLDMLDQANPKDYIYFEQVDKLIPEAIKKHDYPTALSLHLITFAHHLDHDPPTVVDSLAKSIIKLYETSNSEWKEFEKIGKMGQVYHSLEMIDKAYENYLKSIRFFDDKKDSKDLLYTTFSKAGYLARLLGDVESAENLSRRAIELIKESGNDARLGYEYNNLGNVYLDQKDLDKALEYYQRSLKYKIKTGEKQKIGAAYNNIALIQYERGDIKGCLDNLKLAVSYYELTENEKEALITTYQNICQVYHEIGDNEKSIYYGRLAINTAQESNLPIIESWSVYTLEEVYRNIEDYKQAYNLSLRHRALKDSLFKAEMTKNIAEMKAEFDLFESEKKQELQAVRIRRQYIIIIGALIIVIGLVIIVSQGIRNSKNQKKNMFALQKEQERSEKLLANVLPGDIIEEIKAQGKSHPRLFHNVAVLNIDIVDFTKLADTTNPDVLFSKINSVFTSFDDIISKNQCQRIKTSGDAYLAVSGMFNKTCNFRQNILNATIEIMKHVECNYPDLKLRAGISCGNVVGAVVGSKNFIYDIFGATVNTAFRLQEGAEPGSILVDEIVSEVADSNEFLLLDKELVIKDKQYKAKYITVK